MRCQSACQTAFSNFILTGQIWYNWYWEAYSNEWFISVKCSSNCIWRLNKTVFGISEVAVLVKNITSNVGYVRICNFYLNIHYWKFWSKAWLPCCLFRKSWLQISALRPANLSKGFMVFPKSLQENAGLVLQIGHDYLCVLSNHSPIIPLFNAV